MSSFTGSSSPLSTAMQHSVLNWKNPEAMKLSDYHNSNILSDDGEKLIIVDNFVVSSEIKQWKQT